MPMVESLVGTLMGLALAALVRLAWRAAWSREPRTASASIAALQRDVEFFLIGGAPSLREFRELSEPALDRLVQARGLAVVAGKPAATQLPERLQAPDASPGSLRQRAEARQAIELSAIPPFEEVAGTVGPDIVETP